VDATSQLGSPDEVSGSPAGGNGPLLCPFDVSVETIARFLNLEIADHDVYDGLELQWFDDEQHGTGMLAFLSRRADGRVDYYVEPGLQLDRGTYEIGAGIGAWVETRFEASRLEVGDDGVVADVRFQDRSGRPVELQVDDRAAGRRRTGELLAPIGAGIEAPVSLLLVHLKGFDLVRRTRKPPVLRIGGQDVAPGTLPGAALHRRHLIKAAAPLTVATVCRGGARALLPIDPAAPGPVVLDDARGITGVVVGDEAASAELLLDPALPPLTDLVDGRPATGAWEVRISATTITGGTWRACRDGRRVELGLEVSERWKPPAGLPLLLRIVTRVVPTFRRWPTTYRWRGTVDLDGQARIVSGWERTGGDRGVAYRRATGS
jgi:hypothetical protein